MSQPTGGTAINSQSPVKQHKKRASFPLDSEAAFSVVVDHASASPGNPTFMQNQIALQRNPSTTQSQASALARALSIRSNCSVDSPLNRKLSVRSNGSGDSPLSPPGNEEKQGRSDSSGSSAVLEESMGNLMLQKNPSLVSLQSVKSVRSVRSVGVVGTFPLGSLRVHSPSPTRSPNNTSHFCQKSGDVFVVRDVTPGALFGFDAIAFVVKPGKSFDGIHSLPPGAHFVWGGSAATSVRTGFWVMSKKLCTDDYGEVYVKRWNKYDEAMEEEPSKAEAKIQRDDLPKYFELLQEYKLPGMPMVPTSSPDSNLWRQLTSCIKGAYLTKVTGYGWNNWQVSTQHDYRKVGPKQEREEPEYDANKVLRFAFPKVDRSFSLESYGRERTEQAMDTSGHVNAVIDGFCTHEDSDEIIGELQFCYITGMLLGNLACQEHWAHVMKVVFRAFKLVLDQPDFGRKLIEAAHAMFVFDQECFSDGSIFDVDTTLEQSLKVIFTTFKARLNENLLDFADSCNEEQKAVGKAFGDLEAYLWKKGWDLRQYAVREGKYQLEDGEYVDAELMDFEAEDERGEYAPVIVELDNNGRDKGLISF